MMYDITESKGIVTESIFIGSHLENTLGPVLVQIPPNWKRNLDRLKYFLELVPKELRWAVEIRDPNWLGEDLYSLLTQKVAAFVSILKSPQTGGTSDATENTMMAATAKHIVKAGMFYIYFK